MAPGDPWHRVGHTKYQQVPGDPLSSGQGWETGALPNSGDDPAPGPVFFKEEIKGDLTNEGAILAQKVGEPFWPKRVAQKPNRRLERP